MREACIFCGISSRPAVLRVLSGVLTAARRKLERHGFFQVLRCSSPEGYSGCLVPSFLMVSLSQKLQAESAWRSRQRWASPRCFHRRHSHQVTESHMCFICHNKVAGAIAVELIKLTNTNNSKTQSGPHESLTTEERAYPEELFSASWVSNQCGESLNIWSKVSHVTMS